MLHIRKIPSAEPEVPMEQYVSDRYTQAMKAELASRFGVSPDALDALEGFESFVYLVETPSGDEFVMKVTHSDRRNVPMLHSEAEFTRFLASRDVDVAAALESRNGNLVETIDDGHGAEFLATAWSKAPGGMPPRDIVDDDYWHAHGALLGKMHAVTGEFVPGPDFDRPHWDSPVHLADSLHIPDSDPKAKATMEDILATMRSFPRTPDVYGLVHLDAHLANVHWDGSTLTIFDFDDCGYTWFADDLAIVMYYAVLHHDDPREAAATLWPPFANGYREHRTLQPEWTDRFDLFMRWRDHLLYGIVCRDLLDDPDFDADRWIGRFHERQQRDRLVDYDFTRGA